MRSDTRHGGQYLRIREGTQMFAFNLAKQLPESTILLKQPVTHVEQVSPEVVRVNGRLQCRKVICTVPPPIVKKIGFVPPLPEAKRTLLDSYGYGFYHKVMAVFKSPFWVEAGFCGLVSSFKGPACVIRDTSVHEDSTYVLTCFLAGSEGRKWSDGAEEGRREALIAQLESLFGEAARSEFLGMVGHRWNDEEWTGNGCPCSSLGPGVLSTVGHALLECVGDVHFAGTETSDVWRGLLEGAVRSGQREGERVVNALTVSTVGSESFR